MISNANRTPGREKEKEGEEEGEEKGEREISDTRARVLYLHEGPQRDTVAWRSLLVTSLERMQVETDF